MMILVPKKSRRITAPVPQDGVTYRATNKKTGEAYESGDVVLIIRRLVSVGLMPGDEWTFSREEDSK